MNAQTSINPSHVWSGLLTSLVALAVLAVAAVDSAAESSWAFAPGAYTHSPASGTRVVQYAQHEPVEGLPDPDQTISRYWRTRTNIRGADGSSDTIYEVRSFGNSLGGFDAQRERGYDAQLDTLDALRPFRHNPYLFFGGLQGYGYGLPGYPAAVPGTPTPQDSWRPPMAAPCEGEGCASTQAPPASYPTAPTYPAMPYPGMPGTAYPYAPPTGFVAPMPYFGYAPWYGYGGGGWPNHPYGPAQQRDNWRRFHTR